MVLLQFCLLKVSVEFFDPKYFLEVLLVGVLQHIDELIEVLEFNQFILNENRSLLQHVGVVDAVWVELLQVHDIGRFLILLQKAGNALELLYKTGQILDIGL